MLDLYAFFSHLGQAFVVFRVMMTVMMMLIVVLVMIATIWLNFGQGRLHLPYDK